jgi:CO dehydrogenase/acetyl-CoA synthase beta subunit
MKLVTESLNEFKQGQDPYDAMNIGLSGSYSEDELWDLMEEKNVSDMFNLLEDLMIDDPKYDEWSEWKHDMDAGDVYVWVIETLIIKNLSKAAVNKLINTYF